MLVLSGAPSAAEAGTNILRSDPPLEPRRQYRRRRPRSIQLITEEEQLHTTRPSQGEQPTKNRTTPPTSGTRHCRIRVALMFR